MLWTPYNNLPAGHALIPEARRPVSLVAILNVCAWLLVATGLFQIVISKLSKFQWVSEREREREIDRERERVGGVLAKCCHCSCNCRDLLFWGDFLLVAGGTHGWGDWAVALFQVVFSKLSKFQWASESERELESVRCGHTYCKTANCAL